MQKFNEFEYKRPDMNAVRRTLSGLTQSMQKAGSADDAENAIRGFSTFESSISTQVNLAHVRHTIDT